MSTINNNSLPYEEAIIQDTQVIPYYREFKNTTRKIVHIWEPIAKYKLEVQRVTGPQGPLESVTKKLVERQGLNITLKTSSGSYQEIRIPCTDELWDNIYENQIWKFLDDEIYLKFNENGEAYEYIINGISERDKTIEFTDEFKKLSRTKSVRDVIVNKTSEKSSEEPSQSTIKNIIYKFDEISKTFKVWFKPTFVDDKTIDYLSNKLTSLAKTDEGLEVMEIIDDKYIISKLKNNYVYLEINE
jgi:hypothetical protein